MKPVIKKNKYYNLLLMRDDSAAYSFRMSGGMLKSLLVFFGIFVLCAAGGIAGGVYYWKKYRLLHLEYKQQETDLKQTRAELDRLINFQSVMKAGNSETIPQAKNEEIGVEAPANRMHNATAPTDEAETESILTAPAAGLLPVVNATAAEETPAPAPEPEAEETDAALPLNAPDSLLRIDNFSARAAGRRLHIAYELSAARQNELRTLTGTTRYRALHADGTAVELAPQDNDGVRFSIQRMKLMSLFARPVREQAVRNLEHVEVFIDLSDGTTYHEIFAVTQ